MKPATRSAVLALAASLALAAFARANTAPVAAAPARTILAQKNPAVVMQFNIFGYDNFFHLVDLFEDNTSATLRGMAAGMGNVALGINPLDLVDTASHTPARAILYHVPRAKEPGLIFDFPAADGDPEAALDKLADASATGPNTLIPVDIASLSSLYTVPDGTRMFYFMAGKQPRRVDPDATDDRIFFMPHGKNIAFLPMAADGDLFPAQAARLLDTTPWPRVYGPVSFSLDFDALLQLLPGIDPDTHSFLQDLLGDLPFRSIAYGLGIEGKDHLRLDLSVTPRDGHPLAPALTTSGPPSNPLANAILFPDAIAAGAGRYGTPSLVEAAGDWYIRFMERFYSRLASRLPAPPPFSPDDAKAMYAAEADLLRIFGSEYSWALLPPTDGVAAPGALLSFPDDPAAALDALPAAFTAYLSTLLNTLLPDDGEYSKDNIAEANPRLEAARERTVQGVPVRTYALRIDDDDDGTPRTIQPATIDAAVAGPALYLGTLPDSLLSGVLDDLLSGTTSRGPVVSMPSFASAYSAPNAPANASAGYIRVMPVLRNLISALRTHVKILTVANGGDEDDAIPVELDTRLDAFLAATADIDLPLAFTQQWQPDLNRNLTTYSLSAPDLRSLLDYYRSLSTPARTP